MQKTNIFSAAVIIALIATVSAFSEEPKAGSLTADQKKEIQGVVRDLIMSEPDLIEKSIKLSMEKKQDEERAEASKAVKENLKALFENPGDPILGNPNGTTVMVVFMDPYCGYCRKFQSVLLPLTKERKDLKIIYKALPIMSAESKLAAQEELAANAIGRFSDYHEAIYESAVKTRKERLELAAKNNIDMAKLKENIPGMGKAEASSTIDKRLEDNIKLAAKLKINGTPAFVIGEDLIPGYVDKAELVELLDKKKK